MRESFVLNRGMADVIRGSGLGDREELALYRGILAHAFGGDMPELSKVASPMCQLIGMMIDQQQDGRLEPQSRTGKAEMSGLTPAAAEADEWMAEALASDEG